MNIDEILEGAATEPAAPQPTARRSFLSRGRSQGPVTAGWPTVSLLPVEVRGEVHQRTIRIYLLSGVVAVGLLVAVTVAGANAMATSSHEQFEAQSATLSGLQARVAKFSDVRQLQSQIVLAQAAQRVGSSTAIDWQARLDEIETLMPSGFRVTSVTTDSATPIATYPQSASPLEGTRVSTILMTVTSSSIAELPAWLRALPAVADVSDVSPVVTGSDDSGYTVVLTVHLNEKAYVTPLKAGAK